MLKLVISLICLVIRTTTATPIHTYSRIWRLGVGNQRPPWVLTPPQCPTPRGRDALGACPDICQSRFQCGVNELCCANLCGTMSCTEIEENPITCHDIDCSGQGLVCVTRGNKAKCECAEDCPNPTNTSFICASDSLTYMSRCQMDKEACRSGISLSQIRCPRTIVTTPRNNPISSEVFSKPIAYASHKPVVAREGDNVTMWCHVDANPRPRYFWQAKGHRGYIHRGQTHHRVSVPREMGDTMHIRHVRHSDAGTYTCESVNIMGYVTVTFRLIVRVHPEANNRPTESELTFEEKCLQHPETQNENCNESPAALVYSRIWFYNRETEACDTRTFRDCSSLTNKYQTRQECERTCRNRCVLPPQVGHCRNFSQRIFYNKVTGNCEHFVYNGCGGNQNNFRSVEECRKSCPVPLAPSLPQVECPLCSKNIVRGFCRADFVLIAQILEIFQPINGDQLARLHITRVVRDNGSGMQYLNLSDPEQAIRDFALTTNRSCPCPNLHSLMHRPTTNGETTTASCGGHSRRSNSACPNVIITGQRVNGSPTITDESLGVAAQPKNIIRLQKAETTTGVCQFLDLLVETDA